MARPETPTRLAPKERLHRRSEKSMDLLTNSSERDPSTSELTSGDSKKRGKDRHKYPALRKLMLETPNTVKAQYEKSGGALKVRLDNELVTLASLSSSSTKAGHSDEKLGKYARLKLQAEEEGRLEEFMQKFRDRAARRREMVGKDEMKGLNKYRHACRKLHLEELRAKDPEEAQRREESLKAKHREASKRYYHAHLEKERLRHKLSRERNRTCDADDVQAAQPMMSSQICHDFDLNDPASYEEDYNEDFHSEEA